MDLFNNIARAFKHKNFRYYFNLQIVAYIGSWVHNTAQSWLIYKLTNSPWLLGLVAFASLIPTILFAPLSGIITDRFKRKNVLIVTQILFLFHGVILAVLYYTHVVNEWQILFLAFFFGIVNSFDEPARESFVPLLVNKEDLISAISISSIIGNTANIFGPALGGLLIATYNEGTCFVLNAILHFPLILFLIWVSPRKQVIKEFLSPFHHIKEGFLFSWNNTPIRALLLLIGIFGFCGVSFSALLPIFSDQILHHGAKGMGVLLGVSGIGAVFGGLLLASRHKVTGIKKVIANCTLLFSVCVFLFAYSKSFFFSMLLMALIGFCYTVICSGSNTALQAMTDDHLRGRVIGLYSTMVMGMYPLGSLVIGFMADKIGVSLAVAIGAGISFIAALYFRLKVPMLMKEAERLIN